MQKTTPKTILFATHQAFTTRYLLQTDIFKHLKKLGHRLVILSPNGNDPDFRNDYLDDNVFIERFRYKEMEKVSKRTLYRYFTQTRAFILPEHLNITTIYFSIRRFKWMNSHKTTLSKIFYAGILTSAFFLRKSLLLRNAFNKTETALLHERFHQDLFDKYKPDLMVIADLGTIHLSNIIMREARKNKVPIASVILSWDNLTAKGIGGVKPDYAVAWNDNMRYELENYHEIPQDRIFVGGIAHFDAYFADNFPISNEQFRSQLGIKDDRKVIFFGTSSPSFFRENLNIIEILCDMAKKEEFYSSVQIIIRIHPAYIVSKSEDVEEEINTIKAYCESNKDILIFNEPMMEPRTVGYKMPVEDMTTLGSILKHSDVMVTQFSTLMLEGAIFDLPVINTGFDDYRKMGMKTKELRHNTHLKRIIDKDIGTIAETPELMLEQVNKYLEDPSIDRTPRTLIRKEEGGPNKGHAGKAIADYLDSLL